MIRFVARMIFVTACALGLLLPARAQADSGLPIEPLLRSPILNNTSLSPDGTLFAYTVCDAQKLFVVTDPSHKKYTDKGVPRPYLGCAIWLTRTQTQHSWKLTGTDDTWLP